MTKPTLSRNYNFSDAILIKLATRQLKNIAIDYKVFADYQHDFFNIDNYQKSLANFENCPNDVLLESEKMIKIAERDKARKTINPFIKDIKFIAKLAFYTSPETYKSFGDIVTSKLNEKGFLAAAAHINQLIITYRAALALSGLTDIKFEAYQKAYKNLKTANEEVAEIIAKREQTTIERVTLANELYKYISHYSEAAKILWKDKNIHKYNNYLIYDEKKIRK
jgi:hypothetical protein